MRIEKATVAVAVLSALAAVPALGAGEGPRYTYAEIAYTDVDVDDIGDGDGFAVGGSFGFAEHWHVFGGYQDGDLDVDGESFDIDYQQAALGIGYRYGFTESTDLVLRLSALNRDLDVDDGYGVGVSAGVRSMLTGRLEVNAGIEYTNVNLDILDAVGLDDDTALTVGGVFNFTDMFAVTANASFGSDFDQYGIGVRAYFGSN